jgi:hypothetical protein
MVHTKLTLYFLDIPTSFSQISKFEIISGIYLNKNEKRKGVNRAWAESDPCLRPFGEATHRPLWPHARGRDPTGARPGRLCGPPCVRGRDGAGSPRPEMARWRGRPRLAGGSRAAGSGARARRRWGRCVGQGGKWRGSPNRSGAGGVAFRRRRVALEGGGRLRHCL